MENNDILKLLGKNLKLMREKKRINQAMLSEKTGFKQSYISKLENGDINITYLNLVAYCQALGITPIHVV